MADPSVAPVKIEPASEIAADQKPALNVPVENGNNPASASATSKKEKTPKAKPNKKSKVKEGASEYPLELSPPPIYIQHRIDVFEKLKKEYDDSVKGEYIGTSWIC